MLLDDRHLSILKQQHTGKQFTIQMKQINESMAEVEHDHHERISMEKPIATGSTKEVSTLSVALANACALESPSAWTLNMFKYGLGDLV